MLSFLSYSNALLVVLFFFFFFNDTATTEIYTLSLHDALPISTLTARACIRTTAAWFPISSSRRCRAKTSPSTATASRDRKSTRLNSSHGYISYAVFCLKKKKKSKINNSYISHQQYTRLAHTQY